VGAFQHDLKIRRGVTVHVAFDPRVRAVRHPVQLTCGECAAADERERLIARHRGISLVRPVDLTATKDQQGRPHNRRELGVLLQLQNPLEVGDAVGAI
jgi:hypothetical protein